MVNILASTRNFLWNSFAGYYAHTDFMYGRHFGDCMRADKKYLQRRIQTPTEKHLQSIK